MSRTLACKIMRSSFRHYLSSTHILLLCSISLPWKRLNLRVEGQNSLETWQSINVGFVIEVLELNIFTLALESGTLFLLLSRTSHRFLITSCKYDCNIAWYNYMHARWSAKWSVPSWTVPMVSTSKTWRYTLPKVTSTLQIAPHKIWVRVFSNKSKKKL